MVGMARGAVGVLVAALLVASLVAVPAGGTPSGAPVDPRADRGGSLAPSAGNATLPAADRTVTRVRVFENGSARWTIRFLYALDDEDRARAFREFRAAVRGDGSPHRSRFERRIDRTVRDAANATGREMAARNVAVSTTVQEVPRRWGVVTYGFTWSGFARVEGERLVVGDALDAGRFLSANDTLAVEPPAGYRVASTDPPPDDRVPGGVRWHGPRVFEAGEPTLVLAPGSENATAGSGSAADPAGGGDDGTASGEPNWLAVLVLVAVTGAVTVATSGYVAFGRDPARPGRAGDASGSEGSPVHDDRPGSDPPPAVNADRGTDPAGGDSAGGPRGEARTDGAGTPDETPPPGAILTDEDRVIDLLKARGGQAYQSTVAEELEWSASKTSRVLSGMAEDGTIEKVRIGRQNVIRLPPDDGDDDAGDRRAWGDV